MLKEYTTIQGDTFDIVAFKVWGNEKLMHRLIQANPGYRDTVYFSAGVRLVIPEIQTPVEKGPVPPWQK